MKTLTNFKKRYPYILSLAIMILISGIYIVKDGRIFPYGEIFLRKNIFRIRGR